MSGRFADAAYWRQIAGRRQGEQRATREWPVLALHSRLLGGEPHHPRWSVETAACQASTIGQLTTACATWFRDANEDDISSVGCWRSTSFRCDAEFDALSGGYRTSSSNQARFMGTRPSSVASRSLSRGDRGRTDQPTARRPTGRATSECRSPHRRGPR
jgi:hypothetical protein